MFSASWHFSVGKGSIKGRPIKEGTSAIRIVETEGVVVVEAVNMLFLTDK